MKLRDLLISENITTNQKLNDKRYGYSYQLGGSALAIEGKLLMSNLDSECVVAIKKSFIGMMIVIKGKVNYFTFIYTKELISRHNIAVWKRIYSDALIMKALNDENTKTEIIDAELYKRLERELVLKSF